METNYPYFLRLREVKRPLCSLCNSLAVEPQTVVYFCCSSWGLSQAGGRPVLGGGMSQSTLPALVAYDSS